MTKIEHARQLLTKNPKITPNEMCDEMGLPLKTVYLLRSQAKASMKKAKKSLVSSTRKPKTLQQFVDEHNMKIAGIQGWDDEPVEGPSSYRVVSDKLFVETQPQEKTLNPLLAKIDRLREELADARAVIRYLEKRLEGK